MRLFGKDKSPPGGEDARELRAPARVRIDSGEYPLTSLTRKLLVIDGFDRDFVARQYFYFSFLLPLEEETAEVPTRGKVLNVAEGRLVARYFAPQPYYQRLMRQAIDSLPLQAA